jgi:hypothetical protein
MTEGCSACTYADEHGSWPMPGTHCRDCHRSWVSMSQAHCVLCHENFATDGVAEKHWIKGVHTHPSDVPKLECREEGHGPVWRGAGSGYDWSQNAVSAST